MDELRLLTGERQSGESNKALQACNDYLRMGVGRSLRKLTRKYSETTTIKPPTKHLETLKKWSVNFGWVKRAEEYDVEIENIKTEYANEMMKSGLALDYERVSKLKDLFKTLEEELRNGALWVEDSKSNKYNSSIISDIRGVLDDIAKETGGRVKKTELTGKDGGPITTENTIRIVVHDDNGS